MLSFATEFPLDRSCGPMEFLELVRTWILDSPHTQLVAGDLSGIPNTGGWSIQKGADVVQTLFVSTAVEDSVAFRWKKVESGIEWDTSIIYSRQAADTWVGIHTSRESYRPARRLPPARKPVIARQLLELFGGALDGELSVLPVPHKVAGDQVDLAARLILGATGYRLPIVYISCGFLGNYIVDANALASDLSGMAHVVVEPDRKFSRQLQIATDSENVYGGTVGIYWPDGAGRRSLFVGPEFDSAADIKREIIEEVRSALMHRRPLPRCTWSAVQEAASKEVYAALKASGSTEVAKYIEAFDVEMEAKEQQLTDAEAEIARLKDEIKRIESLAAVGTVTVRTGPERNLYNGEMAQIVRDAIEEMTNRVADDSRRQHVLMAMLKATPSTKPATEHREALKEILRDYKSMNSRKRRELEELGFTVEDDGKHHKLTFQGDDRYTFSLPKSGGDWRGGLNAATDISRLLF